MSQDKPPKHKPQQKHTLSEVLKSLQDLIRTDLVPGQNAVRPPAPPPKPASPPPPTEPDSFNDALDALETMIERKIVDPVERAREAPPEAPPPEDALEIDWGETTAATPGAVTETIELEPLGEEPPETPPASDEALDAPAPHTVERDMPSLADNVIELETLEAKGLDDDGIPTVAPSAPPAHTDNIVPLEVLVVESDDALELDLPRGARNEEPPLTAPDAPATTESQHAFDFPPATDPLPPLETLSLDLAAPETPSADAVSDIEPPEPALPSLDAEPLPTIEPAPEPEPDAAEAQGSNAFVVEFKPTRRESSAPEASPDDAKKPADDRPAEAPRTTDNSAVPTTLTDEPSAPAQEPVATPSEKRPAAKTPKPAAAPRGNEPATPVQTEIPVLSEIADLAAASTTTLPDAGQAREIAIRVIAKLNIERRKAGEAPLDIKTIEKLQQYLADALHKRSLNKPT